MSVISAVLSCSCGLLLLVPELTEFMGGKELACLFSGIKGRVDVGEDFVAIT